MAQPKRQIALHHLDLQVAGEAETVTQHRQALAQRADSFLGGLGVAGEADRDDRGLRTNSWSAMWPAWAMAVVDTSGQCVTV